MQRYAPLGTAVVGTGRAETLRFASAPGWGANALGLVVCLKPQLKHAYTLRPTTVAACAGLLGRLSALSVLHIKSSLSLLHYCMGAWGA